MHAYQIFLTIISLISSQLRESSKYNGLRFFFFYSLNQTQILLLLSQVLTHLELDTDK